MDKDRGKESLSRREFLKTGSTVMAGAAGLAAFGAPAILSGQNVNSRIRMAMIGTGSRGCSILRAIANQQEAVVTDLCDVYPPHLEEGVKQVGNPKVRTWDKWEKVLELKDVDAVIVSPPLFLHVPVSVASLDAGKHVFSEKSMGLTMKQLNEMTAAVEKHPDKVYLVGYQSRLNEAMPEIKRLVSEGSIGKISQFYVHFDRNQTWKRDNVPPEWERVLNWRLYKEYCAGLLTEVVTHEVDQVLDVLGTMPTDATFHGSIEVYKDGREHHDNVMGTWMMEDGVIGVGTGHLANSSQGMCWSLLGTHGTIESAGGQLKLYWETDVRHLDSFGIKHKFTQVKLGQSLDTTGAGKMTPGKVIEYKADGDYDLATAREFKHFYDCILNGTKPVMDAASCRRTSIAALMAYTSSMEEGRRVTRAELEAQG
jgi:predicted dehydrogenase